MSGVAVAASEFLTCVFRKDAYLVADELDRARVRTGGSKGLLSLGELVDDRCEANVVVALVAAVARRSA